jgi:glycerophosphoryl diester phosphodiesterase
MELKEVFLLGKKSEQSLCEDDFFFSEHFAAVMDGSTAKTMRTHSGKTPGKIASELIKRVLSEADKSLSASDFTDLFNQVFQNFYREEGIFELTLHNPSERCAASLVLFSRFHGKIFFWGDCAAFFDGNFYMFEKKIDTVLAEMRSVVLELAFLSGKSEEELRKNDEGREFLRDILVKAAVFQNGDRTNPYYYEKIDGFGQIVPEEVAVGADVREIVLASDGYPKVFSTLAESEAFLSEILSEDPLLFRKYKATKAFLTGQNSFDDRCYLRFSP